MYVLRHGTGEGVWTGRWLCWVDGEIIGVSRDLCDCVKALEAVGRKGLEIQIQ